MTSRIGFLSAAVTVLVIAAGGCRDDSASPAAVEVRNAWVRPTPNGTTTGAVYMTVRADVGDALIAVRVDPDIAASAVAHETVSTDGQMSMEHATGIALPAGDEIVFEPGGLHVMLEGLGAPLVAGDAFQLTLDFDAAPDLTVTVDVREDAP